ncbi:ATPdependent RNA helicase [Chamberlinius hualienensis]
MGANAAENKNRKKRRNGAKLFEKKIKLDKDKTVINRLKAEIAEMPERSLVDTSQIKRFLDLPISQKTLIGLKSSGYEEPTEIQKEALPLALRGLDILGAAKTGSGKTLAFMIPVIELLFRNQWSKFDGVGALIITPVRELAYQIFEVLQKIGRKHDFSAALIIGGNDRDYEKDKIDQCNIIICTPGRLLDHMDQNPLFNCTYLKILVLDEADKILEMGFAKELNAIVENLPVERQTLLFSATQTKSVKDLARLSLKDPAYVSVHENSKTSTPDGLVQCYVVCNLEDKFNLLWSFIKGHLKKKILVFMATCKQVKFTYDALCKLRPGTSVLSLYGTLNQKRRMTIYNQFRDKRHCVLIATDIAARGLDFPAVNWVIQMDCPEDVTTYIHRAGRTARFEKYGEALLVLLPSEEKMASYILERRIPITQIK